MHNLDQAIVSQQIKSIGSYISHVIRTRAYSKNKIAEHADISINTLKNVLNGNSCNMNSLTNVAWVMGLNLQDVINGAAVHGTLPNGLGEPKEAGPAVDTNKLSSEEEKQSKMQLAARLGMTEEELGNLL